MKNKRNKAKRAILFSAILLSVVSHSPIAVASTTNSTSSNQMLLAKMDGTAEQKAFIALLVQQAQRNYSHYGVLPSVTIAQAILESNWGRSDLGSAPHHNLFGIKASSEWKGEIYEKVTQEYSENEFISVKQPFRSYATYDESILDHGKFFTSTEWRKNNYAAFLAAKDYKTATDALQNAGYATAPNYATSLQRIIEMYRLYILDPEVTNTVKVDSTNDNQSRTITSYTGLKSNQNNQLMYVEKDIFQSGFTGLYHNSDNQIYYIVNGIVDVSFTGLFHKGQNQWSYVKNGKVDKTFTGLVEHYKGWYYINRGELDWTFTGLVQHHTNKQWFYVKNGKIDWQFTGLFHKGQNQWSYVKNGKVDKTFTGLVEHYKGWYYINRGELDWTFTGLVQHYTNKRWFYVQNGKIDWRFIGLVQHQTNKRWFYVQNGEINWRFTGVVFHTNKKWYYVKTGELDWLFNGNILQNSMLYAVEKGVVINQVKTDITKTVYLDAGHGGIDSGAAYYGLKEKDLTLDVSNRLKSALEKQGYTVLMTREEDVNVDFRTERSKRVNETNSDLFISIHFNATGRGENASAKGIETYWYRYKSGYPPKINQDKHDDPIRLERSELLSNAIHNAVIASSGAFDRGVRRESFAVLRETAKPATLVELGFMDNYAESQKMRDTNYIQKLTDGLFHGILNYYTQLINLFVK